MGKINGKFVVLLDVNRILSIDEVAVVAALGQGNGGN
jgi:purine-binding chemotaxis protein CheW